MMVAGVDEHIELFDERSLARKRKVLVHELVEQERALAAIRAQLALFEDGRSSESSAEQLEPTRERWDAESLERQISTRLLELESAISRIDSGAYGRCERCDDLIDAARLALVPQSALCAACTASAMQAASDQWSLTIVA